MFLVGDFDKITLKLPENKIFEISTINIIQGNKYIQSIKLNDLPYNKSYISHADIMNGGTLVITMGNEPNTLGRIWIAVRNPL